MARKRVRRSRQTVIHSRPIQRDLSTIANRPRLLDTIQYPFKAFSLTPVEDRRTYHPDGPFRPARTFRGTPASVSGSRKLDHRAKSRSFRNLSSVINFQVPSSVLICVRRKSRREVLFARKKTRRGSRSGRSRNWFSSISCRR